MGKQSKRNKERGKASAADAGGATAASDTPKRGPSGPSVSVGLDFGLAHCRVGRAKAGVVDVVANEAGSHKTPSVVAFTDDETLVGEPAFAQRARNAANTVADVRRLLGARADDARLARWRAQWAFGLDDATPDDLPKDVREAVAVAPDAADAAPSLGVVLCVSARAAPKRYTPEFVASLLLRQVRSTAEDALDAQVKEAVIGVGVGATHAECDAVRRAALAAGLRATLLPTPLAAALAYARQLGLPTVAPPPVGADGVDAPPAERALTTPRACLVVEFGASHAAASVLELRPDGSAALVHSAADEAASTRECTALLLANLVQDVHRKTRVRIDDGEHKRALAKLAAAADEALVALANVQQHALTLEALADDRDYTLSLSRPRVEEIVGPVLGRLVALARDTLASAAASGAITGVDDVILSGGGCAMPRVLALLAAAFPDASVHCSAPDEAVVVGCARYAAMAEPGASDPPTPAQPRISSAVLAPHSICVAASDGALVKLIPRGMRLPATCALDLSASGSRLALYECETTDLRDAHEIASVRVPAEGAATNGAHKLAANLCLHADGRITLTARSAASQASDGADGQLLLELPPQSV